MWETANELLSASPAPPHVFWAAGVSVSVGAAPLSHERNVYTAVSAGTMGK